MEKRQKQIIIILVYLIIFALFIFAIYSFFKKDPDCFDGTQNQNEGGIDCGGVCQKQCDKKIEAQDLIVEKEKTGTVLSGIAGKYDFYALITNPNAIFGSKKFDYRINFKDETGKIIVSRNGFGFILPGERKYIVENGVDISNAQSFSADMKIENSDWVQMNDYYQKPDLKIINKTYNEISGGTDFAEAGGLLKNNSPYDFGVIKIQIILKGEKGEILALNSTQMKTVKAGEERDFKVLWPNRFSGAVNNVETQTEVNIFDSDTFPKNSYQSYKFQRY